jgi:hypothetical protein
MTVGGKGWRGLDIDQNGHSRLGLRLGESRLIRLGFPYS